MDVDIVKTSAGDSSMETMAMMMMQMEKFPELLSEPFYNSTYQENNQFPGGTSTTTTATTVPIFNVAPPSNDVNLPMTSPLQQTNVATPSGRFRMNMNQNQSTSNNSSFLYSPTTPSSSSSEKRSSMAAMREMIFRIAVMQPIQIDQESIKPPKRRNVKISKDPQSVAARHRRERISERIRILQRLVPGGTKMDTASMLDEAVHYVKFLKKQVQTLEQAGASTPIGGLFPANVNNYSAAMLMKGCQQPCHMVGSNSNKQLLS